MHEIPSVKEFIETFEDNRMPIIEGIDKCIELINEWAKENNYQIEHIIFIPKPFNSGTYKIFYLKPIF